MLFRVPHRFAQVMAATMLASAFSTLGVSPARSETDRATEYTAAHCQADGGQFVGGICVMPRAAAPSPPSSASGSDVLSGMVAAGLVIGGAYLLGKALAPREPSASNPQTTVPRNRFKGRDQRMAEREAREQRRAEWQAMSRQERRDCNPRQGSAYLCRGGPTAR